MGAPRKKRKSNSKRLRDVLFVLYQQQGDSSISFDQFYDMHMDYVIEQYKKKLK